MQLKQNNNFASMSMEAIHGKITARRGFHAGCEQRMTEEEARALLVTLSPAEKEMLRAYLAQIAAQREPME